MNNFRRDYHQIFDLYNLVGNEGFSVDAECEELIHNLCPKYSEFESTFIILGESKEPLIRKWSEAIKKEVSQLSEDIVTEQTKPGQLTEDVHNSIKKIEEIDANRQSYQHDLVRYNEILMLIEKPQS